MNVTRNNINFGMNYQELARPLEKLAERTYESGSRSISQGNLSYSVSRRYDRPNVFVFKTEFANPDRQASKDIREMEWFLGNFMPPHVADKIASTIESASKIVVQLIPGKGNKPASVKVLEATRDAQYKGKQISDKMSEDTISKKVMNAIKNITGDFEIDKNKAEVLTAPLKKVLDSLPENTSRSLSQNGYSYGISRSWEDPNVINITKHAINSNFGDVVSLKYVPAKRKTPAFIEFTEPSKYYSTMGYNRISTENKKAVEIASEVLEKLQGTAS